MILDPFWEFMEKRWDRDKTRRPRIQEVVEGVGGAAAHWRTAVPRGSAGRQEDSGAEGESGGLDEREFSLYVVSFALKLLCSRDFPTLLALLPVLRSLAVRSVRHSSLFLPPKRSHGFCHYMNGISANLGRDSKH